MRVLIVSNTYPPADISGVGALVYELAHQLGADGHGVRVLTRQAPPAGDPYAVGTGGGKMAYPLLAAWLYLRLARRGGFDLVHVHESDGAFVVLALRLFRALGFRWAQSRLVATLQVSYRRERKIVRPVRADGRVVSRPTADERLFAWVRAPLHALLGRLTARLSDALVAPSRVTAGELVEDYGARDVHVIYNGIAFENEPRAGSAPAPGADPGEAVVLYVGRMRTRKAVAVLLEAFAEARRTRPDARLVLVGDGEQRTALEAHAEALGLGGAASFLGGVPRAEVGRWYARARVYCLPSLYEGFPVAILEAMAAGLPVVSTRVSGIPEAVAHGDTGLLVDTEAKGALASALGELLDDPERARRMGERGRRRVEEEFSIDAISGDYLDLWQNLANPPSDPSARPERAG
ncbi:MAG: glycosyltransferase family 4 protein [Acidobacteriota bacterium]